MPALRAMQRAAAVRQRPMGQGLAKRLLIEQRILAARSPVTAATLASRPPDRPVRTAEPHLSLAPSHFAAMQQMMGRQCTMEAYPGPGAPLVRDTGVSTDFEQRECAGHTVWLHAPPGKVQTALA